MDVKGIPFGYVASISDITDEKLRIEDLNAFTTTAAHDINSPMAKIAMIAEAFRTDNLDEEQKAFLSTISATSVSLCSLLADLLMLSEVGSGKLIRDTLNTESIVREVCKTEIPSDFSGTVHILSLPEAHANERAVVQVFTNLISNAVKYSSRQESPNVEIGSFEKHGRTVYYVKDNGIGMVEEQIASLFQPFNRFHPDFDGHGIGLTIVRRIIDKHGGSISVESKPGQGTTFSFTLAA